MVILHRARHEIDASGMTLGRLASRVAVLLRGKHKPTYTPNVDAGDFVRITNARAVRFSGRKETDKLYHRFSGYPGGIRTKSLRTRWAESPAEVLRDAIRGMLPRNRQRERMIKRLTVVS